MKLEEILVLSLVPDPKMEFSDPKLISGIFRRLVPPSSYIALRSDSSCRARAYSIELNSTRQVKTVA